MSKRSVSAEEARGSRRKSSGAKRAEHPARKASPIRPLVHLQQQVGNRAVQRLLAQRSADSTGPAEVEDETAERINRQRGGGQPLDSAVQQQMSTSTGDDYSQVKVHSDLEANDLSQQLGAKAFTTGQDVFFRDGEYQPHTAGGQELLAHELTHVTQQRQGMVGGGTRMQVNAPGDTFERQADDMAQSVTSGQAPAGVQRESAPEEEEAVQMQAEEEEAIQMQEEEEPVQMQEEEEEAVQMQEEEEAVQMQEDEDQEQAV